MPGVTRRIETTRWAAPASALLATVLLAVPASSDDPAAAASTGLWHDDVSRLNGAHVTMIVHPTTVDEIREALDIARARDLPVSISAMRHSQGGHVLHDRAVVIDMSDYDDVLAMDAAARCVRVQAGATWAELQKALDPSGLAVCVMQSSNIFSIGGSLGVNCHGRDPRFGPIIETVRSFRLLDAGGRILDVDRDRNAELFRLVIGGFGLFGVILDVDLEVTTNDLYERRVRRMSYMEYLGQVHERVLSGRPIALHSGRLSIAPGEGFLREMYDREYLRVGEGAPSPTLREEENVWRDRFFFGLSRRTSWGKRLRWWLQKHLSNTAGEVRVVTRNNAMCPPIAFIRYASEHDTDILQEYFVPINRYVPFVDGLREILLQEHVNLMHATVRYVPRNVEAFLSYATADMFSIVLYLNVGLSPEALEHAERWTRRIVDLVDANDGTYYLAYQRFPSQDQIRRVYPQLDEFFALKRTYDPDLRFRNRFYAHYVVGSSP